MPLSKLINRWGRDVILNFTETEKSKPFKAFLQPLRYKNKMYLQGNFTDIGLSAQGYYLYIGPTEFDLESAKNEGFLSAGEEKYQIDRVEKIYRGNDVWYVWAVLRSYEGETE